MKTIEQVTGSRKSTKMQMKLNENSQAKKGIKPPHTIIEKQK